MKKIISNDNDYLQIKYSIIFYGEDNHSDLVCIFKKDEEMNDNIYSQILLAMDKKITVFKKVFEIDKHYNKETKLIENGILIDIIKTLIGQKYYTYQFDNYFLELEITDYEFPNIIEKEISDPIFEFILV
jgi:hypothetical protein